MAANDCAECQCRPTSSANPRSGAGPRGPAAPSPPSRCTPGHGGAAKHQEYTTDGERESGAAVGEDSGPLYVIS
jgi:hypothetical protein